MLVLKVALTADMQVDLEDLNRGAFFTHARTHRREKKKKTNKNLILPLKPRKLQVTFLFVPYETSLQIRIPDCYSFGFFLLDSGV